MRSQNIAAFGLAAFLLSGCGLGESRLNPFNWFGGSETVESVEDAGEIIPSNDPRPLIAEITDVIVEETPGGVIIRAVGLPPEQGWHNAALVSETRGRPVGGILTFAFRAVPPDAPTRSSTVQSREIVVGRFVSNIILSETSEIRILGARNSRIISR